MCMWSGIRLKYDYIVDLTPENYLNNYLALSESKLRKINGSIIIKL